MRILRTLIAVCLPLIAAFIVASQPSSVLALTESPVQFEIPDTTLTVNGYASPSALVQVYDGDVLIGTVTADQNGFFSKTFAAMRPGLHNFQLQYEDKDGLVSDKISNTLNLKDKQETAVEYFLPPTLEVVPGSVTEGGLVAFRGSTVPGAIVEISVDGGNTIVRPQSNSDGSFTIALGTTGYFNGEHIASAIARKGLLESYQTEKRTFQVLPIPAGEDGLNVGPGPNNLFPPEIISPISPANITDESVLVRGTALPNVQIIVYQDGEPIGSTFSDSDGNWFFNVDIYALRHEIRAIACKDGQCSDFSNVLELIFRGEFGLCSTFTFRLNQYRFWDVSSNDGIDLQFQGLTGNAPYEILIDWGDETTERFNHDEDSQLKLHHVYGGEGQYNGSVTILDASGCETTRYFSVEVLDDPFNWSFLWLLVPIAALSSLIWIVWRHHEEDLLDKAEIQKGGSSV